MTRSLFISVQSKLGAKVVAEGQTSKRRRDQQRTSAVHELQWLPVKRRIEFMHQVNTQRCPSYVADGRPRHLLLV